MCNELCLLRYFAVMEIGKPMENFKKKAMENFSNREEGCADLEQLSTAVSFG